MKVIMTILGLMSVMYVVLMICCRMAEEKVLMKFDNLIWTKDNDGRKLAKMRLNDVYSVHVIEFSEDGIPYYIVHIWKDGDYYKGAEYMTRDEVSALMEKLQTIED